MENSRRNHHARSDDEDNSSYRREQLHFWETKVVIIQRAWRATLYRKQSWRRGCKHMHHQRETAPLGPCQHHMHHQRETAPLGPCQTTLSIDGFGPDPSPRITCCSGVMSGKQKREKRNDANSRSSQRERETEGQEARWRSIRKRTKGKEND
ncbi:hypothetical protein AAFF_G00130790 [Aldrovandia affinis]|uniref:Fusion protein IQCJ-SCHIP1 N-terminal domain-containing protein n=1 Tax=Aldrovandia affinis TaxID=143900 RepID=A0AAD7RR66_9TELE|nr:hypothetical protein AAFF_G00130790 [Aldrovandia affinis]